MPNRRTVLLGSVGLIAIGGGAALWWRSSGRLPESSYEITKTEAEWRMKLTPEQFNILREKGTERPFSSLLNAETSAGIFSCAACDLNVYSSADKFKSGTGWPSFTRSLSDAIRTQPDRSLLVERTEVVCRRCGGHLGHIFDDGPQPTGKRHCLNGVALKFVAQEGTTSG